MRVAGLDLSLTGTGLVIAEAGEGGTFELVREERVATGSLRGMERLAFVRDEVLGAIREAEASDVALESYAVYRHNGAELGELGGVVRLALWEAGFSYWDVPPATLKRLVSGKGNAPKDVMLREVFRRWGFSASCSDTADAYGLARGIAGHRFGHERQTDRDAWSKAVRVEARETGPSASLAPETAPTRGKGRRLHRAPQAGAERAR